MRICLLLLALFCLNRSAEAGASPGHPRLYHCMFSERIDDPPVITCPSDAVVSTPPFMCSGQFIYNVLVSDDQPGWTLTQTAGYPSGTFFPLGTTVNQFLATDTEGNTATCSFSVSVKDNVPPVAACSNFSVKLTYDYPEDCYEGKIAWIKATAFDNGSYDNCSTNLKFTVQRKLPYSECISSLNPVNGHPECDDQVPDSPSEYEQATVEGDTLKLYCCEAGTMVEVLFRAYQMNPDGSYLLGSNGQPVYGMCTALVTVTECLAGVFGNVGLDADENCQKDIPNIGVPGLIIKSTDSQGNESYASSNQFGNYRIPTLPAGPVLVELNTPLPLWLICNPDTMLTLASPYSEVKVDFAVAPLAECPLLSLDLSTVRVRPCDTSTWFVKYCNLGAVPAEDAFVTLVADEPVTFLDASMPFSVNNDTVIVQVGDVGVGQCGNFWAKFETPCDSSIIGDQVCIHAHIFPDTFCLPPNPGWSGAQIIANAECSGDSVRFTLTNAGIAPTAAALDYVIIDDMVIMREGQVPAGLEPGEVIRESVFTQGSSLRIISEQEGGHPVAQPPSLAVENCNGITLPSGLLNFSNESGNFFSAIECREITASFDPNEKTAFPRGYSDAHLIEPGTRIDYQLNFQNTGNDTAFLVILRDTLPALLDPATLQMGVSSHAYSWQLEGAGVLVVKFANILLPDSSVNETASHGFVKFDIAQKPDNPVGAVIQNRAGIYFDGNPVVLTNIAFHTIDHDFLETSAAETPPQSGWLKLYPNPSSGSLFVPLDGDARLRMSDSTGRQVFSTEAHAPGILIQRSDLKSGLYIIEVISHSGRSCSAKVIWQNAR